MVYHYFDSNILLLILVQKISLIFDLSCAENDSEELLKSAPDVLYDGYKVPPIL